MRLAGFGYKDIMGSAEEDGKEIAHDRTAELSARTSRVTVYAVAAAYEMGFRGDSLQVIRSEAISACHAEKMDWGSPGPIPGLIPLCIAFDDRWLSATDEQIENGSLVEWLAQSAIHDYPQEVAQALASVAQIVQPLREDPR